MGYTYYDEDKKKKKKSQDQGSSSRFQMDSESPKENKGFFDVMKKNNGYIQNNNGTHTAINRNTTNNVGFFDAMKKNSNFKNNSNAYDEAIELNRKHYDSLHKNNNQNTNIADYSKIAELNRKHYEDRKNALGTKDEIDVDQVLADNNVKRKDSKVSPEVQGIFDEAFAANDYRTEELKKAEENLNNVSPFDTDKAAYNKAMYDYERAKTNLELSKNKEKYDAALESKAAELGLTEEEVEQLRNDTEQYNYGGEKLMHSLLGVGVNKLIPAPGVANSIARQANLNYDKQMLEDFDEDALKESIGNRGYQLLVERNRKNEDFAERNQIEKDKALDASANYLSINDNSSGITDALDDTFYASMEEQQNYNYLYNTTYDKAYEEAINSGASEEEAKTMANSKANEEANKYLDTLGLDAKRTAMFAGFSKEYAEEHPILATASSIAFKPLEAIGQIDNALKYIGGNPNDENSLANLPAQMNTTMRGTVRSNIDNPFLKFGYDVGTSMGDMVLSNRLGFGNNNLSLILMGGEAANETYTQLLNEGYTKTDAMVMSTVAGGAEIITEKIPMEEIFSADKKGIRQILKSALFEGVEEVESDVINDIADILYSQLSDRGQIKSEIEAYMAKGMSEEDAQYAVFNDHLKQAAYDFGAGAGSGGLANAYHGAVTTAVGMKNTNQLSEEAQKTIANIAVNSKDPKLAKLAEKVVKGTANAYEKYKTVRDTIDENNIGQQIENKLIDEGVSKKEVEEAKAAIVKTIAQVDLTEDEYDIAQTEPVRKVLSDITKGDLDAAYERQLAVNDALKLTKNNVNSTQTQNVTPSVENTENEAENNVESADESKKIVALSNYARNAQQRLGTMPIESLNDIQDVVNDEEGNIQIVTNDGNKVNNPYVKNRALGVVISNATTLFNDGASAKAYIQNFDPAMNLKAYNTITTEMIKAGKADAGTDKSTLISTVKSLQNMGGDVGYYAKKLPASFFNDMYAYGVKEENQRSEVVAGDPQRNVINAIASQFSNSGLNITIEDNNTEYNGKLVGTNNLVLSSHADKALMSVLSHELTHYFKKKTNLYNDYEKAVIDFLKESGQYEGLVEAKKKQGYADNEIDEEIVADAAENFLSDKKVIDRVCKNDKNLANKIISWLNQTIKDLKKLFGSADPRTAEGRIMKNLEKQNLAKYEEIRDLWVNAYEAAAKSEKVTDTLQNEPKLSKKFNGYEIDDDLYIQAHDENLNEEERTKTLGLRQGQLALKNYKYIQNSTWTKIANAFKKLGYTDITNGKVAKETFSRLVDNSNVGYYIFNDDQAEAIKQIFGINSEKTDNTISPEKASEIAKKAEKVFGTTNNFKLAGYLDVNGKLLDFSEGQGYRVQDHREISEVLDLPEDADYSDGLIEFMNEGNIRLQEYGIDIAVKPNDEQRKALRDFFNSLDGEVIVDFSNTNGDSIGSAEYTRGTASARILNDIDSYFNGGDVPSGNADSLNQFRYSLKSDSQGRTLSDGQRKYFAESKIRDDKGNLLVVYHGTPNGEFTIFKNDLNFFSADKAYADLYQSESASARTSGKKATTPKTFEGYLNIEKPFTLSDPKCKDIFINKYVKGGWSYSIDPYQSDAAIEKQIKDGIDWTEADNLKEFFNEEEYDYDGLILDEGGYFDENNNVIDRGTSFVTFNSNQFKNIDNLNPTKDDDIRFSMKQPVEQTKDMVAVHNISEANLLKTIKLGGFVMPSLAVTKADLGHSGFADISVLFGKDTIDPRLSKDNKVYSGDAWTPTMPKAVKKIDTQKQRALEERLGLSGDYSDTLQGDFEDVISSFENNQQVKEKYIKNNNVEIEKKKFEKWKHTATNKVVDTIRDRMYTKDEIAKFEEVRNRLVDVAYPSTGKISNTAFYKKWRNNFETILKYINDNEAFYKYLENSGLDEEKAEDLKLNYWRFEEDLDNILYGKAVTEFDRQAYAEDVDNYINEHKEDFRKFIEDTVKEADIYEGEYLRNDKDTFTPSGNRRKFDQLHDPYTLHNILAAMKKQKKGDVGIWFGGASNLKGASTRTFSSIEDIKKSKEQIQNVPQEEIDAKYKELNGLISDIDADICKNNGWQNSWHANDDINSMIAEAFSRAVFNEESVRRVFNKYDTKITHEDYENLKKLKAELDAIPVKYFEAKPERIVGFDEIKAVLIPDNSSAELKEALDKAGIPYEEYKAGDEADRLAKLNSHDEVKFSKKGNYSYDSFNLEDKMNIKNANDYNFEKFEVGDSRKDVVTKTKDNIAAYNVDNGLGSEALNNKYIGITNIKTEGIRHSLNRNFAKNGMGYVTTMLPVYFENSIPINEAFGRNDDTEGAYVLIGMFSSDEGDYLVRSVVDHKTKNLNEINWLYALNTKKESSVASATRDNSPKPLSNYSISDFIELAKKYYPNDFSKDVAKFFGYERGKSDIEGLKYSKKMLDDIGVKLSNKYSDADEMFFSEDTWENSEAQTSAKNTADILKEGFNDLQKLKEAGKAHFTHADALRLAEKYQREYGTSTGKEYIANNIESIFAYIENNRDNVRYDDMLRVMRDAAMPIVEKQSNELDEYDDFRKYVKDLNISLNDQQRAEVINTYGSMKTFRKAIGSRINVTDNGQNIDSLWQDICEASGYYLDPDENSNTQILALADALDSMRDIGDNSGMSTSDKAYDLALNIYTDYFKLNGVENITKQMKKQIEDYKKASEKAYTEILNKQKEESKAQLDKLRNELKRLEAEKELKTLDKVETAEVNKQLDRYRQRILKLQDDIKVGKVWRKHARLKAAESRQMTILRNRIKNIVNDLSKRITNPTEGHHVPVGLVNATIDVLQNIDLNTGKSVNMAEKLEKLSKAYEAVRKGYGEEVNPDYDETLQNMINRLGEMFKGRSIAKLSQTELEEVFNICKALQTQIRNASKLIDSEIKKNIYDAGKNIIEDVRATKGVGDTKLANFANAYITTSENAERFFNRLSGYKDDSTLNKLYQDLNEGSHKMMQIEFDVSDIMKPVLEGKENQKLAEKFKGDNVKDWIDTPFKDKNGNTIRVPQSFRASLDMHMMNEQNLKHILYGGLTLPNEKLYSQGKIKDAYNRGTTIKLVDTAEMNEILKKISESEEVHERNMLWKEYAAAKEKAEGAGKAMLNSFVLNMTNYERAWVRRAKEYFHEYSGKKINETSLKLNGYTKANIEDYFPIRTDSNYTRSEMEGVKLDSTIEGWGNLKTRVNGSNPIVLEGLDKVLNAHSKMLAKYAGMAIPIRNFNKVYNVTLGGYKDSVKKAIGQKFGERSQKYINDLFTDLQTSRTRDDALSKVMNTVRSNFAQATLTTNLSVAWKQAASYPTAAAELGWDAIAYALGSKSGLKLGQVFLAPMILDKNTKNTIELASKYTPLLKYRNLGNSTQELGDLKNQRTWLQKNRITGKPVEMLTNWIQNIDTTTVSTLWKASEYRVAKDNPKLEQGTDEFYKEVAKVFNNAVERTQPNYTVLQRPDILRNPNEFLKQVFMFKTQPLQNLGIIMDSTGNLKAKIEAYKSDRSAENLANLKKARGKMALAVSSQLVSAMTFSAMTLAVNALLHNLNGYRDDDKELTLESIFNKYFNDIGSSLAGSLPLGSETYSYLMSALTGDKWYDLSVSTIDTINNVLTDVKKVFDSSSSADVYQNTKKLIKDTSVIFGIPAKNAEKILNGFIYHYQDAKNGEFGSYEAGVERTTKQNNHRLYEAMKEGDWDKFDKIYADMDYDKVTKGSNSVTSMIKADYMDGNISEETAEEYLKELDFSDDDAHFKVQEWEHADEEGGSSDYVEVFDAIDSYDTKAIIKSVNEMKKYGYDNEKLQKASIAAKYKDKYIELYKTNKTEAASLKSAILTYYQACGKDREKASKQVDNWLKEK